MTLIRNESLHNSNKSSLRRLDEFHPVLKAVFQDEPRAILIGGQACNFYSSLYSRDNEELSLFLPFTSHDIDIFTPDDRAPETIAKHFHASLHKAPRRNPSPVRSALTLSTAREGELFVQFMKGSYGIKDSEIVEAALEFEVFDQTIIRVIHPVYLLQSKLHCLRGLDQKDRQDKKHVNMAICFCACFVHELIAEGDNGRAALTACQHILQIATSDDGLAAYHRESIRPELAIPFEAIRDAPQDKLKSFVAHNLDRSLERLNARRISSEKRTGRQ
ncbi:MAG: hypothetical protein J0I10_09170 [Verrucomicrobia bacterium]|nr:hypothetical protein [Verrucomicrobiota bacterium]